MRQTTSQKQSLHLSPQQFQVAKLIQATSDELEALISEEISNNFVLEAEDCACRKDDEVSLEDEDSSNNRNEDFSEDDNEDIEESERDDSMVYYGDDEEDEPSISAATDDSAYSPLLNYRNDETFREHLISQLDEMELNEDESFLAHFLVDSLDDSGYLLCPLTKLVDDLSIMEHYDTTPQHLEDILVDIVQSLEPAGTGARDLRECLLIQLQEKTSSPAVLLAYNIINQYFEDFSEKRYERLCLRMKVSKLQLAEAIKVILRLSPKPGGQSADVERIDSRAAHVKPDFGIHCDEDGELIVTLYDRQVPTVRISEDAKEMMDRIQQSGSKSEDNKKGLSLLKENIAAGNQFIDALRQRRETLSRVISVIAQMQKNYFVSCGNPDELRPMVLQDVADRSGYDVSTISRVSNSKYIDTDFGIISVKDLFSSAIQTEQGSISNASVMECLKELLESEDKKNPLSDDALSDILKEKGYPVARRTVAKYRERLNYPTARLRREA